MARSTMLIVSLRTWHGPRLWPLERKGGDQRVERFDKAGNLLHGRLYRAGTPPKHNEHGDACGER